MSIGLLVALGLCSVACRPRGVEPTTNPVRSEDVSDRVASIGREFGVELVTQGSPENWFPPWAMEYPVLGSARAVDCRVIIQGEEAIRGFLAAYPRTLLAGRLKRLTVVRDLRFYGKEYAGTFFDDGVVVSVGTDTNPLAWCQVIAVAHAEFSSILLRSEDFSVVEWKSCNGVGFDYGGNAIGMSGLPGVREGGPDLWKCGVLTKYATASVEEDFNAFVEYLWSRPDTLEKLCAEYPGIRQKRDIVVRFYKKVDEAWSWPWRDYGAAVRTPVSVPAVPAQGTVDTPDDRPR